MKDKIEGKTAPTSIHWGKNMHVLLEHYNHIHKSLNSEKSERGNEQKQASMLGNMPKA